MHEEREPISCSMTYGMEVGGDLSVRDRIGSALRWLASKIDGRIGVGGIRIKSAPQITNRQARAAIRLGLQHAYLAIKSEVQHEALERICQTAWPSMFLSEDQRFHKGAASTRE